MEFHVTLAALDDTTRTKIETIVSAGAIQAMMAAEKKNPGWISVSAQPAA